MTSSDISFASTKDSPMERSRRTEVRPRRASRLALFITALGAALGATLAVGTITWAQSDEGVEGGGFLLYEWGLVLYDGDEVELATSNGTMPVVVAPDPAIAPMPGPGPGPDPVRPMTRKPLIYLEPQPGWNHDMTIDVTITLPGGSLYEIWPLVEEPAETVAHGPTFTWNNVQIQEVSCGAESVPEVTSPWCTRLPLQGFCEAAELSRYLAERPNCLRFADQDVPLLLYNGLPADASAPIEIDPASRIVGNVSAHPVGPLFIVEGRQIYRIDRIEAGSSATLEGRTPAYHAHATDAELLTAIREILAVQGLTRLQVEDFMGAWSPDVLATPFDWQVFGFLDRSAIDAAYPLQVTPAPAQMTRVMAFVQ